jgi:hypothetical protein
MAKMLGARMVSNHRVYDILQDDGSIVSFPSVTTILKALPESEGLKWFKNNFENAEAHTAKRAMVGTTCHFFFESECAKQLPNHTPELEQVAYREYLDDDSLDAIGNINRKIKSVMKQHDFKPITLEEGVWSDVLRVAGRVDFKGYLDGKLCIVDLKTSKKFYDEGKGAYEDRIKYMVENDGQAPKNFFNKHALQLSMYKQAFLERDGDQIEELWILRVNENNKPELRLMADVLEDVKDVRELYFDQFGM